AAAFGSSELPHADRATAQIVDATIDKRVETMALDLAQKDFQPPRCPNAVRVRLMIGGVFAIPKSAKWTLCPEIAGSGR
ncbi:MAG: hypothetical protein WBP38_04675, partial [Hyphomicrobium sp.]